MKKIIALLLVLVMVLSMAACQQSDPNPTDDTTATDPTNPATPNPYATYYQTFTAQDNGSANYWDDKGSEAGDNLAYIAGSFWGTAMNEEKDGYEWICELAKEKPVAVNPDEDGLATIYKFEVKVGSEMVYNTLSTKAEYAAFAGREVALEDYLTPWKELYNQSNGIARGPEGAKVAAGTIKGIAAYYAATADGFNQEAWDAVGITAEMVDGKAYLTFEFDLPTNSFYAMYYLASSLYCPIPADFLELIGGLKNYGTFANDGALSPVDTTLSTSYYVLESWQKDKEIVYKKNDLYPDGGRYQVPGIYTLVLPAMNTDSEAAMKEFLAGNLDAASIPQTMLDDYRNDERTTTTLDSTTFKLNMNTCNQEEWEALFGENGTITQTPKENYWNLKPAMSNDNFLKGINYALNRKEFAEILGRTPSANYFGSSYLSDPENGVSYNSTQAHKDAMASMLDNTDGYGYSLTLAQQYFKAACDELIAAGAYAAGDEVHIEIAWMYPADLEDYHPYIAKYLQDAFNTCGGGLTLVVDSWAGETWSDVYYEKMMLGQFDLGFGSISGNSLNPLNFFEVLRSDNTSGFTLNWGTDTSVVDPALTYDGRSWSFNSLWEAADKGALVDPNGNLLASFDANLLSSTPNADGTQTLKFNLGTMNIDGFKSELSQVLIYGYPDGANYEEEALAFTVENGIATVTVTADQITKYANALYLGYDLYYTVDANGTVSESYWGSLNAPLVNEDGSAYNSSTDASFVPGTAIELTAGEWVTYVAASYEERTVILGILEKWAVENFLTGLVLFGNGGYVMYNERVNPGTGDWSNYIPGYGFGILSEGNLLG